MFLRRIKDGKKTYYYIVRRTHRGGTHEYLSNIGFLDKPSRYQEECLVTEWAKKLVHGTERAHQKEVDSAKSLRLSHERELGRTFDVELCRKEFEAVYKKYGKITKTILEHHARPAGEISWGTSTITTNLKKRGLSLKQLFDEITCEGE